MNPPAFAPLNLSRRTRAEAQAYIDSEFLKGHIGIRQWRVNFDLLSLMDTKGDFLVLKEAQE